MNSRLRIRTVPPTEEHPLAPEFGPICAARAKAPQVETLSPADARLAFLVGAAADAKRNEPIAKVEDRSIPGPAGGIPLRVYTPVGRGPFPVLVYFHGGGWVLGNLDSHDDICRSICRRSGAVVAAVDYRLAPEHTFPAPLEDCLGALKWCTKHATDIGGDPDRIAVGGDSAGGNLAAAVVLHLGDRGGPMPALQVLIYPVTNCEFHTASYLRNATGYGLTRATMMHFWKCYLAKAADAADPYASPLRAEGLAGLPPALVLTAQYDVLCDEGEAYAVRLAQAGVPVTRTRHLGLIHGFLRYAAVSPGADRGLQEIADGLRAAFES